MTFGTLCTVLAERAAFLLERFFETFTFFAERFLEAAFGRSAFAFYERTVAVVGTGTITLRIVTVIRFFETFAFLAEWAITLRAVGTAVTVIGFLETTFTVALIAAFAVSLVSAFRTLRTITEITAGTVCIVAVIGFLEAAFLAVTRIRTFV